MSTPRSSRPESQWPSFGALWQVVDGLASSRLMRAAVAELTQRAHAGEILVIMTRGKRLWRIEDGPGTIIYTGGEARRQA